MKKPGSQEATEQSKRLEHEDLAGRIVVELKTVKAAVARSNVWGIGRRHGLPQADAGDEEGSFLRVADTVTAVPGFLASS